MKLVKQLTLYFQEGTSDKVYEIDLCESGDGFLVNFRYGKRGAALKEGTKTIFPVSQAEAEKAFAALEAEKRKKGYVAAGEASVTTASEPATTKGGTDKRRKAILKLLKAAAAGEEAEHWKLSRIIWRAGDLKIQEAIPYCIRLADVSDPGNIYSVVWAIGRCGTDDALGFLQELQRNRNLPEYVQALIFEVILKLSDDYAKATLQARILDSLPRPFKSSIVNNDARQLRKDLHEYLFHLKTASNEYLIGIDQLTRNNATLRPVFLEVLEQVKLERNYFKYIRAIFKTAAMLEDYNAYGIIAKQIEKQPFSYNAGWMQSEQKKLRAFSSRTKAYLSLRVQRQLRKYGEAGEPSYVELAMGILLAFRDEHDEKPPHHTSRYQYSYNSQTRSYTTTEVRTEYDSYSQYLGFNYILFKNSARYKEHHGAYACVPPYKPGQLAPMTREEAFPRLWNNAPEQIIALLSFSKVGRVHNFAWNVWQANPAFESRITIKDIIAFLRAYAASTQLLGLELARKQYNPAQPDTVLLLAMLDSQLEEAVRQAEQWIVPARTTLLGDTAFVIALLKMRRVEAHAWLRGFLGTYLFTQEQAEIIIAGVIAYLITTPAETEEERRYSNQMADTLVLSFSSFLRNISLEVIKDLFRHSSTDLHAFAGKILMQHAVRPEDLPEDFLTVLLTSDNPQSRGVGIALLGKFPDTLLLERKDVLVSFCLSPLPDVRNAVRPIIMRLVNVYPAFGKELVNLFVPAFLIKESYEGLHDDLLSLLSNELESSLHSIPKERTLVLLNSRYRTSQLIGSVLLKKTINDAELSVPELVKLASNPLEEVRHYIWNTFKKYPDTIRASKEEAVRITDTDWDDTRIFAFDFFRNVFTAADWNTEILISLCDSTRDDVQAFAREMISRFFEKTQGSEYLLKLSQHPSSKVQLFTTAYLNDYASGDLEVMTSLKLYFITLLSQINRGKVAKARVMEFLRRESLKDENVARLAAEIFTRVSVSVAIAERADCIAALRDIQKRFPAVKSPMVVKEFSDYVRS